MKINLPMRNLTGPFTLKLTFPDGRKFEICADALLPLVEMAFIFPIASWQIKGQQGKRRRVLLEA